MSSFRRSLEDNSDIKANQDWLTDEFEAAEQVSKCLTNHTFATSLSEGAQGISFLLLKKRLISISESFIFLSTLFLSGAS